MDRKAVVDMPEMMYSINKANDLLIFRNFEECLCVCQEELAKLRQHPDYLSLNDVRDALCVNAVQALAELNRWQEVLPFVTKLYSHIEEVPANIVLLCILLHAEVKDFPTCAALGTIWLKNPSNTQPDREQSYLETIDIYIGHVLIPANRWDKIEPFLDSCHGLTTERKTHFLRTIRTLRHQLDQVTSEEIEEISENGEITSNQETSSRRLDGDEVTGKSSEGSADSSHFTQFVQKFTKWASSVVPVMTMYIARHLAIIGLVVYILITRADVDLLSWETIHKLWQFLVVTWRRMFAPFHSVKH